MLNKHPKPMTDERRFKVLRMELDTPVSSPLLGMAARLAQI